MLPSPTPRPEGVRAQFVETLGALVLQGLSLGLFVQRAHWAVRGPDFLAFHRLFGEVYDGLATATDRLAERAATLGAVDPMGLTMSVPVAALPTRDGLALCQPITAGLTAHAAALSAAYARAEEMGLIADANALQSLVEDVEKLGWMVLTHTIPG